MLGLLRPPAQLTLPRRLHPRELCQPPHASLHRHVPGGSARPHRARGRPARRAAPSARSGRRGRPCRRRSRAAARPPPGGSSGADSASVPVALAGPALAPLPAPPPRPRGGCDPFRRPRPRAERVDLDAPRPRLTAEPAAWLDAIASASGETRRAYRRGALDLMRRLKLDAEPKLVRLEPRDAVRPPRPAAGAGRCRRRLGRPGPPADGGGAVALRPPPAAAPRVSTTRSSSCGGRGSRRPAPPDEPADGVGAAVLPAAGRAGGSAVRWRSLTRRPARRRVPHRAVEHLAARASSRSNYASGEADTPRRPSPAASHPADLPGYATGS